MDAIILAGGFGTRLRPLTWNRPKPLVPVANQPFLQTLLSRLAKAGVKRVAVSAFHQAGEIRSALAVLPHFGLKVAVVEEKSPLGTGGAIRYAWPRAAEACLVLNGDVLSDFDLASLADFHAERRADASLWVKPMPDVSAFGVIESDAAGQVSRFVEKPKPGESSSKHINAGVYLFTPAVLRLIPAGRPVSVEREVFPGLLARGLRVFAFKGSPDAYWRDIGTPLNYLQANLDSLGRAAYLKGTGCRLARGCRVEQSVLGKSCRVEKGARVSGSVLWEGCVIGEGAEVSGALLASGVSVGAWARISPGVVLGDGAVVPAYSKL